MRHIQLAFAALLIILPLTSSTKSIDKSTNDETNGHRIEVTITGLNNKDLYLGFHYGRKQFLQDTIQLDENGHGVFQGDKKLDQGIYLVITPSKNYFEILVGQDQHFSLEAQKGNFLETLSFKGSEVNEGFIEYQKFMREKNQISRNFQKKLKKTEENADSTEILRDKLEALDMEVKAKWNSLIEEYQGTILAAIIKAMQEPEIPEFEAPEDAANKDSIKWAKKYNYQKNHYFDNIDLSDPRLVKTPILHNKVKHFFDNVLRQNPDTIIKYVDKVLGTARENDQTFEYLARFLINHYQKSKIMGMDEVFVHISEKYYLSGDAHWIDSASLKKLRDRVHKIKPNIIGKTAPDMNLPTINNKSARLHNIDSKYTIVYFWEPGCSHCQKVTPKIYDLYKSYDRTTLDVYAVYTQVDKKKWEKYISKHGFDWINVFDPYNTSKFRKKYDIYSTPTIYLLDEEKKIIAKRIGHDALKKMLEQKVGKQND
jgi:thiol-disulfide isomerase/thioredoxin